MWEDAERLKTEKTNKDQEKDTRLMPQLSLDTRRHEGLAEQAYGHYFAAGRS